MTLVLILNCTSGLVLKNQNLHLIVEQSGIPLRPGSFLRKQQKDGVSTILRCCINIYSVIRTLLTGLTVKGTEHL